VAATNAQAVDRNGIDPALIERERAILMDQPMTTGKPAAVLQKIVDGKIDKYYEEICLLEQPYIKDPDRKVKELIDLAIAKLGENIVVRRFAKFRIGDA
jgi:elongation factor Ts